MHSIYSITLYYFVFIHFDVIFTPGHFAFLTQVWNGLLNLSSYGLLYRLHESMCVLTVWFRVPLIKRNMASNMASKMNLHENNKRKYQPRVRLNPRLASNTNVPMTYDPLVKSKNHYLLINYLAENTVSGEQVQDD